MSSRRFAVIVNPRGGRRRGLKVLERVRPVLQARGAELDVRVTQSPGHAAQIAGTLELGSLDGICVVGGDGTVHEVADGLMRRGEPVMVPLGLIPAGTGNTLHQHLQCHDPLEAARRIAAGESRPLDVIRVTLDDRVVFCVDIVGWGAVADINGTAESLRLLGGPRYALAALWHILRARTRRARLVLDGHIDDDDFLFVIACNAMFTGKGMKLAPRAEIGDGVIDVVVLRRASRRQMLQLFTKVFDGSHLALGYVECHQVRSFAIESAGRELLDLDGEMKGHAPLRADVLPAALRVFA
jgi:sphingosine kinase